MNGGLFDRHFMSVLKGHLTVLEQGADVLFKTMTITGM
jgi:hypothetical protein